MIGGVFPIRKFDFGQPSDNAEDDSKYKLMKTKAKIVSILLVLVCGAEMTALFFHLNVWNRPTVSGQLFTGNSSKIVLSSAIGGAVATTADWLNIRSGPGTQYGVVCTVPSNTALKLIGIAGADSDWIQVETSEGKTGWCSRQYVNANSTENNQAISSEAASSQENPSEAMAAEKLNIRFGPSTKYGIVCTIQKDAALTLMGKSNIDGTWVQVKTPDGKSGWCCRPYLKVETVDVLALQELAHAINPLYIKVSLANQKVTVLDAKDHIIKDFACSSGKSGSETPRGTFSVLGRGISFYNSESGEGGYYWTNFYGDEYLFHSVPFDQNYEMEQKEAVKLGTPASHGCIRLSIDNAKWIYDHIRDGTKVLIQ